MFLKLGESQEIKLENTESCVAEINADILDNFTKTANSLKKIAPKAEDFLYFSTVMMHAAEASALHDDGTQRLDIHGKPITVGWDDSNNTLKWKSSDKSIKPYRNSNGDIFPEKELLKAYKKWVGKPLCIDHKSSSVDHVRGFIVDTYYDRSLKRIVALCALDKAGFPQLARQISTGVSNSVSMGTAVGKAICTDCARVAKSEVDFCDHMKRKSCYGEINVDLNPIELSIVVNGADPKANIKHIIAAANTLNSYVETKQQELTKIAEQYSATISFSNMEPGADSASEGTSTTLSVNSTDLDSFRKDIDKALSDFETLQSSIKEESDISETGNEIALNQLPHDEEIDQNKAPNKIASDANVGVEISQLRQFMKNIETKLAQTQKQLEKLTNTSTKTQEDNMSDSMDKKGYFQGGGGVNEPTPGQPKYTKDPLNEQLRQSGDKQMVGQKPFPSVGSVDGLHPSPESVDVSDELARKKMHARAELEQRALRRAAIVDLAKSNLSDKRAYFQGGGGVNEPTPGKVKYPADKMELDLREKADKQMVGQKPFPGVGSVDGLHPSPESAEVSDELKRKQMLSRAGYRAAFVRVASDDGSVDTSKTSWKIYNGDKLVSTATVDQLSNGYSDSLLESIATKAFGAKLLQRVKLAQEAPVAPVMPEVMDESAESGLEVKDTGKSGDIKETLLDTAEKARDLVSDVVEGVRALTGEQAEMGAIDDISSEMKSSASFSTSTLNSLRKELNGSLAVAMKECVASLNEHISELDEITKLYEKGDVLKSNAAFANSIAEDAVNECQASIADGFKLMAAFVKYANGTKAIVKRAEMEAEMSAKTDEGDAMYSQDADDLMAMISETHKDLDHVEDMMKSEDGDDQDARKKKVVECEDEDDQDARKKKVVKEDEDDQDLKAGDLKPETELSSSLTSKASRAEFRAKLAAEALGDDGESRDMSKEEFSSMLDDSYSLSDDEMGEVETVSEVNEAMMDLAKAPPRVRKEAEAIRSFIAEGTLDASDVDALVAQGLDKDAVAYYKKYFADADGGSEFASELVKEHVKAQMESQLNQFKVKYVRAYALATDMADRGLCGSDRASVSEKADEVMTYNDEAFDSIKRVIASTPVVALRKSAGKTPQVGGDYDSPAQSDDLFSQLSLAFSKSGKRTI